MNQAGLFKPFREDNPRERIPLPWGATLALERSNGCMCLLVEGMLTRGEMLTHGGDAHLGNCQCCQPASQQRHVAPGMSKHQPHFRAHTHPWHLESVLVSTTGGMKGKGGDKSHPWCLPSEPSAVSAEGANPCLLSFVHMDFKYLTGTGKRKTKVFVLSHFPVPPSCPFLRPGASSHPSFSCFAGGASMVINRHLTKGVFECPRTRARLPL